MSCQAEGIQAKLAWHCHKGKERNFRLINSKGRIVNFQNNLYDPSLWNFHPDHYPGNGQHKSIFSGDGYFLCPKCLNKVCGPERGERDRVKNLLGLRRQGGSVGWASDSWCQLRSWSWGHKTKTPQALFSGQSLLVLLPLLLLSFSFSQIKK